MITHIEADKFCAGVLEMARKQHWDLLLEQVNLPHRFRYQWTWRGLHPLPEVLITSNDLEEARLRACLDLVGRTHWEIAYRPEPVVWRSVTGADFRRSMDWAAGWTNPLDTLVAAKISEIKGGLNHG